MEFTRLPAHGKSSFDELYAAVEECLGERKCPNQVMFFGKTFYEHALHQTSPTSRKHYTPKCIRGVMLSPHGNKGFIRTIAKGIIGSDNDPDCRILESHLPYNGK